MIEQTASRLFIPLTVGGGIQSLDDITQLLNHGADKVSLNSSALKNPQLIKQASDKFGRQCICIAIDSYYDPERKAHYCCTTGGKKMTNIKVYDWVQQVEQLGAGELLVTSMGHDGMKQGFDIEHLANIKSLVNIPIIASGGGGNAQHFVELFDQTDVSAGLAASILHDRETTVQSIKEVIRQGGIAVR